ncbi:MAG TPA: alkyl hydroperoxide reductase, partial [Chroococcales cyanobacterium]
ERHLENIRQAVFRLGLSHPVVNDSDFRIWRQYDVHAWPTLVLVDERGFILNQFAGEGHFEELEEAISGAIETARQRKTLVEGFFPLLKPEVLSSASPLLFPGKVLADEASNRLFIADSNHHRVLISDLAGKVMAVAGCGEAGRSDDSFEESSFDQPQGLALKGDFLFLADTGNHLVRRLDLKERRVETIAGTGRQANWGTAGGPKNITPLNSPWDLVVLGEDLFIAMAGAHQIWKLAKGFIGPFAGSGREDLIDGSRNSAALAQPSGICQDGPFLFFADSETSSIRKMEKNSGWVETLVGEGLFTFGDKDGTGEEVRLQHPLGVAFGREAIFLADTYNHKVKILDPIERSVKTVFGKGIPGFEDGRNPSFYEPGGLSLAGDSLFIADTNNHSIRVADLIEGVVRTLELRF